MWGKISRAAINDFPTIVTNQRRLRVDWLHFSLLECKMQEVEGEDVGDSARLFFLQPSDKWGIVVGGGGKNSISPLSEVVLARQ